MKMMFLRTAILCGSIVATLTACQRDATASSKLLDKKESIDVTSRASIRLGESAAGFAKRYPGVKVVRQPAGLDFYSLNWATKPHGVVTFEHGKNTITITDVLSVSTSEDQAEFKQEGFFAYTINSGVSDADLIAHDAARLRTHEILRQILDAGWQQVIERNEPRLKGQARLNYMFATANSNGLDASFVPKLEDWMRIPNRTPWTFYANGAYLDVVFTREPTLTDPAKPGAYLLTFNIKTETEYFRGYAGPANRLRWKQFVLPELHRSASERATKETALRTQGIQIDETYRDPPVPDLK